MRRYFERMERCEYAKRPWSRWLNSGRHGFDGWLTTTISDPSVLLRDLVLARLVIAAMQTSLGAYVRNLERLLQQLLSWASSFFDPND
jgi:choline dehydrogenase